MILPHLWAGDGGWSGFPSWFTRKGQQPNWPCPVVDYSVQHSRKVVSVITKATSKKTGLVESGRWSADQGLRCFVCGSLAMHMLHGKAACFSHRAELVEWSSKQVKGRLACVQSSG
jgi:hypothetical protein